MVDMHCHIVAGIDDGAQNIDDSLAMAKAAVQEGISTIIATPHHNNGHYENPKQDILSHVAELNKRLQAEKIQLTILPGQEPAINGGLLEDFHNGKILTLNQTQYVFVELPASHVPRYTEKMLYDLQLKGLTPIIVHPERNQEIQERSEWLYQLVKKGALAQVTAGSVCGKFGKKIQKFSHELIQANLVHFVASDAHNIYKRSFNLGQAYELIDSQYGVDMGYLFRENAELLVDGLNVYKEVPQRVRKKKFLGMF